ncbi:u3 small nucleolar RNA-associated protein 11 [Paxillus ammoniavirescens]|nr:u3 small nucleolar RNA-associated protein 11 [Paxillus ammoniavirescens]
MTSSLRNSLHRRNHKERSQLSNRAKYGVLEKHKDYVLRARDYHSKQDRLNRLRQKAADRNKDEFYFAMKNEKTAEGVHAKDRGNVAIPMDMVKLLKTQDEGYIRTMRAVGLKKIDRIKRQLTDLANLISSTDADEALEDGEEPLVDTELETLRAAGVIVPQTQRKRKQNRSTPRHILFAEDDADVQRCLGRESSGNKELGTMGSAELKGDVNLGWKPTGTTKAPRRRRKAKTTTEDMDNTLDEERKLTSIKNRRRLLKELAARLARDTQLSYALRELEMQRLLVGKGGRKKVQGAKEVHAEAGDSDEGEDKRTSNSKTYKPRVYKWRIERKR